MKSEEADFLDDTIEEHEVCEKISAKSKEVSNN